VENGDSFRLLACGELAVREAVDEPHAVAAAGRRQGHRCSPWRAGCDFPGRGAGASGVLKNGYNSGAWNGTPTASTGVITSAAAQANPNHNTAIGYADSADGQGVNTTPNTIELTYTLFGDANLDHQVNSADLQILLAVLNRPGSWDQGDFNYDSQVNSADLQALLFTLNTSLGSQTTPMAIAATPTTTTTTSGASSSSDPSPRLVPAIQPTGTTGPMVHQPHAAKVSARKRR
jgi:hypothetical protein